MNAEEIFKGMSDETLLKAIQAALEIANQRKLEISGFAGSLALEGAQSETATTTPETTPEAPIISPESLLATLDTALTTYSSLLEIINNERAKVIRKKQEQLEAIDQAIIIRAELKGHRNRQKLLKAIDQAIIIRAELKGLKKQEQLEAIDQAIIRTEVEALVSDPAIIAELQTEANYFIANPEKRSPKVGFDIVVIPEGLTATDEQAIAEYLQAKITTGYSPYIRPEAYNDKRTPVITGKGFRIAFAPRHYNVPNGSTSDQTSWMKNKNQGTKATKLQTATDAEALAQINNLQATDELNDPSTRFNKTYFRRFDQAPVGDVVSFVCVYDVGLLCLDWSFVCHELSARALVVPKKLNAVDRRVAMYQFV